MQPSLFSQKYNLAATIAIYCPNPSPRKDYIFNEVFRHRAGTDYILYTDLALFRHSSESLKIAYTPDSVEGTLWIHASDLLDETGIHSLFKPSAGLDKEGNFVLFPKEGSLTECDIFSMAFWLLSRYEEHQPFKADKFGRFTAKNSLLSAMEVLQIPVLDIVLTRFFKTLGFEVNASFQVFPTLDIDMGFYYHGKGMLRKATVRLRNMWRKPATNFGKNYKEDPYYTFPYEKEIFKQYNQKNVRYFFLSGSYGKYDKNISFQFEPMRKWAFEASKYAEVGLHPSYQSNQSKRLIADEKKQLEKVLGHKTDRSRQHFLILKFSAEKEKKNTYFNLLNNGIIHDYSMGFADATGFRAGTSKSFRWYNFATEKPTALVVHPFCLMDVTLKNYLGLSIENAQQAIIDLKNMLQKHKLPFCFIFHNESLSDCGEWKNWRQLFELCLQ